MWIDRILELEPGRRMVAIKHVSLAEEHLHDHFAATHWPTRHAESLAAPAPDPIRHPEPAPLMPASLIIEGMAQTAGVLVGHASGFREKVVLAKISRADIELDALPGTTIRYTATIERLDAAGAVTSGVVEMLVHAADGAPAVHHAASIDMMFSHLDHNMGGHTFPAHNFVFGESFRTLLTASGVPMPD